MEKDENKLMKIEPSSSRTITSSVAPQVICTHVQPKPSYASMVTKNLSPLISLKADTGASGHYIAHSDSGKLENVTATMSPKNVLLPDQRIISSTHDATLPIPFLSKCAIQASIFPDLSSSSLLSIGQLCDDDCVAVFSKEKMQVLKNDNVVLEGHRNFNDGLWDVPLTPIPSSAPIESMNAIIRKNQSKAKLASYYHACAFSPCPRTFATAIKNGNFLTWPGLTELKLYKHLKPTIATSMGHLDQERQGLQSTKLDTPSPSPFPLDDDTKNDFFPQTDSNSQLSIVLRKLCLSHKPEKDTWISLDVSRINHLGAMSIS